MIASGSWAAFLNKAPISRSPTPPIWSATGNAPDGGSRTIREIHRVLKDNRFFLSFFDSPDPQDREALRQTLSRLHETLLASRDRLEGHFRIFPEFFLYEAWEQAECATQSRQAREAARPPIDYSAARTRSTPSRNAPPFQAAERPGEYRVIRPVTVDEVFEFVRRELERRFFRQEPLANPEHVKRYLIAELAREDREVFVALFLDNRHRPLAFEKLFYGTIDGCAVHPREVVKRALHFCP